jgi:hypothetical protein
MVAVIADNKAVETCINQILDLTRGAGAEFAPGLVLRAEKGNMRTEAAAADGKLLIRMPEACLIPPADFRFGLEGDTVLAAPEDDVTPLRAQLMQLMLELFNLTGKVAQHRRGVPWWLAAAHPEIIPFILRLRDNPVLRGYADAARAGPDDALTAETFFLSRTLALKKDDKAPPVRMLMPVVDFMNHHHSGSPYNTISDAQGFGLAMLNRQPVAGSTACFARYGDYDALTTWLHYGFVDEHAPPPPANDRAAYAEFAAMLARLKLKDAGLAGARDTALRLCDLQLTRIGSLAARKA